MKKRLKMQKKRAFLCKNRILGIVQCANSRKYNSEKLPPKIKARSVPRCLSGSAPGIVCAPCPVPLLLSAARSERRASSETVQRARCGGCCCVPGMCDRLPVGASVRLSVRPVQDSRRGGGVLPPKIRPPGCPSPRRAHRRQCRAFAILRHE